MLIQADDGHQPTLRQQMQEHAIMKKTIITSVIILAAIISLAAEEKKDPTSQLKKELTETTWQWDGDGGEEVHFQKNGFIEHPGWTKRGLKTQWIVIDKRTVLFKIVKGRNSDRYAILTFNENMTAYNGHIFHHGMGIKLSRKIDKHPIG